MADETSSVKGEPVHAAEGHSQYCYLMNNTGTSELELQVCQLNTGIHNASKMAPDVQPTAQCS